MENTKQTKLQINAEMAIIQAVQAHDVETAKLYAQKEFTKLSNSFVGHFEKAQAVSEKIAALLRVCLAHGIINRDTPTGEIGRLVFGDDFRSGKNNGTNPRAQMLQRIIKALRGEDLLAISKQARIAQARKAAKAAKAEEATESAEHVEDGNVQSQSLYIRTLGAQLCAFRSEDSTALFDWLVDADAPTASIVAVIETLQQYITV